MTGIAFPPSMIGMTETTGTTAAVARPWPWMMGTSFPAVDRHDGHHRGRCEPWPWMMGTTFPPSIGTTARRGTGAAPACPAVALDDRHGGTA